MISLWDVLKASKGLPVSDFYAAMWGKQIAGKYTIAELEGALPLTFNANGEALIDYRIYGNTEQTGTPTPENPIMPSGCGELETIGVHAGQYKLPILSNSTVTNIYLGEVETTRRIKKLVLTGDEICYLYDFQDKKGALVVNVLDANHGRGKGFCSHYLVYPNGGFTSLWIGVNNKHLYFVGILDVLGISTIVEFKSYLAAQYAAGTPVTVWYVLAEPETGIVNEPLMKIGDYADTVSMEQAGVSIPTNNGSTVIDYDGTPKPSQMYIKYLGVKK